jgi:UDP-glucose 4-epimerase
MVKLLAARGCEVTILDDLSTGYRDAVLRGNLVVGGAGDRTFLDRLFAASHFDAVMHFASFIQVGESVTDPGKYYRNNTANTLTLLSAAVSAGIRRFIFSSTAAIFGQPQADAIAESHAQNPINPYGKSKLMVEAMLADFDRAHGLKSACLRYFNAAGADPEGELGERHDPETHLIPLALQVASGRRSHLRVFGSDYDTPDGTCIRDYVHVSDLCDAHWLALQSLHGGGASQHYNLGVGNGFSVRQVIDAVAKVTGRPIATILEPRRAGDPARLVADSSLIQQRLGWRPRFPDLETQVRHAWAWEQLSYPSRSAAASGPIP